MVQIFLRDRSGAVVPSTRVPGQELRRHHLELVSTAKPGPLNQKLSSNLFNKSPGDSDFTFKFKDHRLRGDFLPMLSWS